LSNSRRMLVATSVTATVSDMFEEYAHEFSRLRQEFDDQVAAAKASSSSGAETRCVSEAERRVAGAERALKQMEMEARSTAPAARAQLEPRLQLFRAELSQRRQALASATQAAERRALLGAANNPISGKAVRDRERLLDVNDTLSQQTRQLEEARATAAEAEQLSLEVMGDLRQQREVILRSRAGVGQIGENMGAAGRLIASMSRRAAANRVIVRVVVGVMVAALLAAVYFIWLDGLLSRPSGGVEPVPEAPGVAAAETPAPAPGPVPS